MPDPEAPRDLGGIEGVERLTELVEDVVGDIDHVVDGTEPDGLEFGLKPRGAFLDFG